MEQRHMHWLERASVATGTVLIAHTWLNFDQLIAHATRPASSRKDRIIADILILGLGGLLFNLGIPNRSKPENRI